MATGTEHGITDYLAFAISLRGWAITAHDRNNDEIGLILEGMAASRSTGAEAFRPYYLSLLAERYMETGNLDKGLSALNEALAATDENEQRYYKAEIHRLKGELLLRKNNSTAAEGQRCFERAIEVARKQSGKSFELRATTSLARLLASQGHREDARAKLAEIYNWFTEGFDTADLIEAKTLLDELNSQS